MTLQWMQLKNFTGYCDFELTLKPGINLLIGPNATGKTTLLEALSVALGSIFLGIRGYDSRTIRPEDTRIKANATGESLRFERQYPVEVRTRGLVFGHEVEWARTLFSALSGPANRTSRKEALGIQGLAKEADEAVRSGKGIQLPLIAYYGNGRLWLEPLDRGKTDGNGKQDELSRFMGYYLAIDPRTSPKELMNRVGRGIFTPSLSRNRT